MVDFYCQNIFISGRKDRLTKTANDPKIPTDAKETQWQTLNKDNYPMINVEYFDKRLGAVHSKCWSKSDFSKFFAQES